jgi:DNA repair protein SbcC/Rad50
MPSTPRRPPRRCGPTWSWPGHSPPPGRPPAEAEQEAEANHRLATAELEAARAADQAAQRAFATARDGVSPLGPPAPLGRLAHDWAALLRWAATRAGELRREHEQATSESSAHRLAAAAVVERCRERTAELVAPSWKSIPELRELLAAEEASVGAEHRAVVAARARVEALQMQLGAEEAAAQVAELLGELLGSAAFERWLLDEAMADLVERATLRLQILTAGQYSLVVEGGAFKVRDHRNADEVRDARSLSGGETFLASLALALALGEATVDLAAQGSAPLDSIFLDEGFGTLDPETLDVVASTIEELGSSGRMVGLVTHIRELAERMPTRLEVRRTATTATVERVDS